jgi:glycosyltransferase involved in cell wall biosynthesis
MRTLLLWPIFHPVPTAASTRGMAFAKHLTAKGNIVRVITPLRDANSDAHLYEGFAVERLRTYDSLSAEHGFFVSSILSPRSFLQMRREIAAFEPDVIIASSPAPFLAFEGFLGSRSKRIPFVYDMRDSWRQEQYTHEGMLRNRAKSAVEGLLCRNSDIVFCVSNSLKESVISEYGIPGEKVKVVTNGADPSAGSSQEVRKEYDLVFSGYPARYRNIEELLRGVSVASKEMDLSMMCLGWKGSPQEAEVRNVAKRLGIEANLDLTPRVPHDEVRQELQKARVGVTSLSGDEALASAIGTKTYEYLATGLPVACLSPFDNSELQRFVEDNGVGFYARNANDFASMVVSLLTDERRYSEMSLKARRVSEGFSWKSIVNRAHDEFLSQFGGGGN